MNILLLCDEYPPCEHGGIGAVTQNLARILSAKGNKVFIAGFYPYYRKALKSETDKQIIVSRYFYGSWLLLKLSRNKIFGRFFNISRSFKKYIKSIERLIIENSIDIIEIPDFNEAFRYSGPKMIEFPPFSIPVVVKLHGTYSMLHKAGGDSNWSDYVFKKEKCLLNSADCIISVSKYVGNKVKEVFGYEGDMRVIHNGLVLSEGTWNRRPANRQEVVFASTLSEKKGVFTLLRAWSIVLSEVPDARLSLYGKSDDTTIDKINGIIRNDLNDNVTLGGYVTREILSEIYSHASCAVFPSFAETFGMAPVEAMAAGCPVVFTKRASGPEIVNHKIDGLLVDPTDHQELAEAILYLLKNKSEAERIGSNGAETVRKRFDISVIGSEHITLYAELIGRKSHKKI